MVSPVHGDYRRYQAEIPLIALSKFPRPALFSQTERPGPWRVFGSMKCTACASLFEATMGSGRSRQSGSRRQAVKMERLAATIHCIDDEIIEWLQHREQRLACGCRDFSDPSCRSESRRS
jgi:hypothetical protein